MGESMEVTAEVVELVSQMLADLNGGEPADYVTDGECIEEIVLTRETVEDFKRAMTWKSHQDGEHNGHAYHCFDGTQRVKGERRCSLFIADCGAYRAVVRR